MSVDINPITKGVVYMIAAKTTTQNKIQEVKKDE
jgi:hypothetical protein